MSNAGQSKIIHKNRTLTLEQELAEGKVWSISTNRYRTKKDPDIEKALGLLYLKKDNSYIDLNKKGNRALQHQQERELGIVWHADLEVYCPKYTEQQLKEQGLKYKQFINTYTFSRTLSIEEEKAKSLVWGLDTHRYTFKHTPEREKQLKLIYNRELNTYATELEDTELDKFDQEEESDLSDNLEHTDSDIDQDTEMACREEPRWSLRDLPSFGREKNENPQSFLLSLKRFLNYIHCNPETDDTKVEQAITHLGNCLHDKSRNWFENHVATKRPRDDEDRFRDRTVEEWKQILKNFTKAFHPYGKTLEQWDMAWKRLSWNPKSETIEDFTDRVKQLGDMLDKNEQEQVRTIKMSTPDRGTYQAIMRCETIDEIVETINQLEGFPLIHNPTEATNFPNDSIHDCTTKR